MAKKKFDYNNPTHGVEFYYVYAGDVMHDNYSRNSNYADFFDSLIEYHNFFRTYEDASKA